MAASEYDALPPTLEGVVTMRLVPHADNPLPMPTSLGPRSDLALAFSVSEVLNGPPVITLTPDVGIACTTQPLAARQYAVSCAVPGGHSLEGTVVVVAQLVDLHALTSTVSLAEVPYDDLPPSVPDTLGTDVVLRHAPWGDRHTEEAHSSLGLTLADVTGFVEVSANGATHVTALTPPHTRLDFPLTLAPVMVGLIDAAGNRSASAAVHWLDWVASPRNTSFTPSPHVLSSYSVFPRAPLEKAWATGAAMTDALLTDGRGVSVPAGMWGRTYGMNSTVDFLRGTGVNTARDTFNDVDLAAPSTAANGSVSFYGGSLFDVTEAWPGTFDYEPWSRRAITLVGTDAGLAAYACRADGGCGRLGVLGAYSSAITLVDAAGKKTYVAAANVDADGGLEVGVYLAGTAVSRLQVARAAVANGEADIGWMTGIFGPRAETVALTVTTSGQVTTTTHSWILTLDGGPVADGGSSITYDPYTQVSYSALGNDVESSRARAPCSVPFSFSATGETWCTSWSTTISDGGLVALLSPDGGLISPLRPSVICSPARCEAPQFAAATGLASDWVTQDVYVVADAGTQVATLFAVHNDQARVVAPFPSDLKLSRLRGISGRPGPVWLDTTSQANHRVFRLAHGSIVELASLPNSVSNIHYDGRDTLCATGAGAEYEWRDDKWVSRPLVGRATNFSWDPIGQVAVGSGGELSFGRERPGFVLLVDPTAFVVPAGTRPKFVQLEVDATATATGDAGVELGAWAGFRFVTPGTTSSAPQTWTTRLEGTALDELLGFHKRWAFGVRPVGVNGVSGADLVLDGIDVTVRYFVP